MRKYKIDDQVIIINLPNDVSGRCRLWMEDKKVVYIVAVEPRILPTYGDPIYYDYELSETLGDSSDPVSVFESEIILVKAAHRIKRIMSWRLSA